MSFDSSWYDITLFFLNEQLRACRSDVFLCFRWFLFQNYIVVHLIIQSFDMWVHLSRFKVSYFCVSTVCLAHCVLSPSVFSQAPDKALLCLKSVLLLQNLLGEEQGLMIKSSVCFSFPTPKGRNAMSQQSTDGQSVSHRSALQRRLFSPVNVYVLCVLCFVLFHCSFFYLILSFFPPFFAHFGCRWLLPWADTDVCCHPSCSWWWKWNTLACTHTQNTSIYTQKWLKITVLCLVSVHTALFLLTLHLLNTSFVSNSTVSDLQCTACAFICIEMVQWCIIYG